ncbi:MAG TPA: uroporphyrinogen decarboxylase family protein [Armatimonadota bacterium]
MTSRERVRAAMAGQPVDRVPVFPVTTRMLGARTLGRRVGEMALQPSLVFDGIVAMKERFGFDGLEAGFGPGRNERPPVLEMVDGIPCLLGADGKPWARYQEDDDPVPLDNTPPIRDKKDLDGVGITPAALYEAEGKLDAIRALRRRVGDDLYIAGVAAGQTMNSLAAWRGADQAIYDLVDDPAFVDEAMDRATDNSIEVGKALIAAGVDGIYIGDAWSSASIISPKHFERYCQPRYARTVEAFHALGAQVYLHICGNAVPLLEMIADTGVDALEPLDPLGGVRVDDAVRRIGDRVTLKGGVNTLTLLNGTPEDVRREALEVLDAAHEKCRGLILGSGDDIPRDTPFENIDALVGAINR